MRSRFRLMTIVKETENPTRMHIVLDWYRGDITKTYDEISFLLVPFTHDDLVIMNEHGELLADEDRESLKIHSRPDYEIGDKKLDFVSWQDIEDIRGCRLGEKIGIV